MMVMVGRRGRGRAVRVGLRVEVSHEDRQREYTQG